MRLIDATIQSKALTDYILERKSTFIRVLEEGDNDFLLALLTDYFKEQPTAYDVDKVVSEMEKINSLTARLYCQIYIRDLMPD